MSKLLLILTLSLGWASPDHKASTKPVSKSETKKDSHQEDHGDDHEHEQEGKTSAHDHEGEDDHDQKAEGKSAAHDHEEGEHDEDGHGHEEASRPVGPDKGVLEATEEKGIKLTAEAIKNFGIKTVNYSSSEISLPKKAIFFGLQEKNIYRVRDQFFKRVDFKTLTKTKTEYRITSSDLKPGDQIVVEGLGFLRIAEIAAFGGGAQGHSH